MPDSRGSVPGSNDHHHVMFYGLSTCIWCKRTRQFLESQDVKFDYVYVDLLQGQERKEVIEQIRPWNSSISFPTIVVDEEQSVVGYKTEELKEVLGL